MSGVELIVGAVLGSVPIALEAYDRSGRVFETLATFRHYAKEIDLLDSKLGTQRVIFRSNAIALLTAVTQDRGSVQEILKQPELQNPGSCLAMSSIYKHRVDTLAESFISCRQTADEINTALQELCLQFETIRCDVGAVSQKMTASEWLKHIRSRVKLGLGMPQTEKAIKKLRTLNGDFESVSRHIIVSLREATQDRQAGMSVVRRSAGSLNMLQRYHRVRYASKALHSTLRERWVCSSHECHSFAVNVVKNESGDGWGKGKAVSTRFVTCELATVPGRSSSPTEGAFRLEIEQDCESDGEDSVLQQDEVQRTAELQHLTNVLEANVDHLRPRPRPQPAKTMTSGRGLGRLFQSLQTSDSRLPGPSKVGTRLSNLPQEVTRSHATGPESTPIASTPTPDLSQVLDFCRELHNIMSDCMQRSLIGAWEDPRAQWFYVPAAFVPSQVTTQSISDIIHWIAEKPVVRSFSRPVSVEVARKIAEGIMQFYSTPWLAESDLGQNVRYFNSVPSPSDTVELIGPYFVADIDNVRIAERADDTSTPANTKSPADSTAQFAEARNQLLFSFGILLLEIGYGRPWHELKQSVAIPSTASDEAPSDYRVAEKLAHLLVNHMGLRFPKIVKKCLGCDFGLGETDLDNEDLQRGFVKDVVTGLEQLGERMREMDLGLQG